MKKTTFTRSGSHFYLSDEADAKPYSTLPVGVYTVKYNDMRDVYYLEKAEDFTLPPKLYGKAADHSERFVTTFNDRPNGTGVLLVGEKGSGKTLLTKMLSIEAAKRLNAPTVIVNHPYCGTSFFSFIQSITQPAVIMFDEFEKVYNDIKLQANILTLLDGAYPSKKLYVFTVNNVYHLNENLMNRPGRIYYNVVYKGMDEESIKEYCEDRLNEKSNIPKVLSAIPMFENINFDMVQAIVEEMNRYPSDSLASIFSILNVKPPFDGEYDILCDVVVTNGKGKVVDIPPDCKTRAFYPFRENDYVGHVNLKSGERIYIHPQECVRMDIRAKEFIYKVEAEKEGPFTITLTGKPKNPLLDYNNSAFNFLTT